MRQIQNILEIYDLLGFPTGLDDRQGNRTVEAIPNRRGIVNFYVGYDHGTQVTASTPPVWTDVGLEETVKVNCP